jgi:hypothetical protein
MNTIVFLLVLSLVLVSFDLAYRAVIDHAYGHNWKNDLAEDELIICVKDTVQHSKNLTCHIYTDLSAEQYRNMQANASFFDFNDSFKMDLID